MFVPSNYHRNIVLVFSRRNSKQALIANAILKASRTKLNEAENRKTKSIPKKLAKLFYKDKFGYLQQTI